MGCHASRLENQRRRAEVARSGVRREAEFDHSSEAIWSKYELFSQIGDATCSPLEEVLRQDTNVVMELSNDAEGRAADVSSSGGGGGVAGAADSAAAATTASSSHRRFSTSPPLIRC